MKSIKTKLLIIGAGSAGLAARAEFAKYSEDYLVVDSGPLGTLCARVGCMPSKSFLYYAHSLKKIQQLEEQKILSRAPEADVAQVFEQTRKLRDRFVKSVEDSINKWRESHLLIGEALFMSPHQVSVGEKVIEAEKIIVATGAKTNFPSSWEAIRGKEFSSDNLFELRDNVPYSMFFVGMGAVGLELGQALSYLGVEVMGADASKNFAGLSHPQLQEQAKSYFSSQMDIEFGKAQLKSVLAPNKILIDMTSSGRVLEASSVFMSSGRRPALENLELERAGVELSENGNPNISQDTLLAKGSQNIYFCGDAESEHALLHEARDEGRFAARHALGYERKFERRTPLRVIFTDPAIFVAGESYRELLDSGISFDVAECDFKGYGKAIIEDREVGGLRIFISNDVIVGAEGFGLHADHLGTLLASFVERGLTVKQALSQTYYHPTMEESVATALKNL